MSENTWNLKNKTALVTGATNGIGKVTALRLAAQGGRVVIVSRSVEKCSATVDEIRDIARQVDGVTGIDMCRVRKSGLGIWVDIHVVVKGDMTVRDGHHISHLVKDALLASGHNVMDAVVHIEPAKDASIS